MLKATAQHLAHRTTTDAVELLASVDIPAAPVLELDTVHEHPQTRAAGIVAEFDHPVLGPVHQPHPAVRFGDLGPSVAAPRLGEHNDQIAAELGLDGADVQRLRASGLFSGEGRGRRGLSALDGRTT